MDATLRDLCAAQVPGDTYRNLRIEPDYSAETFKHILVRCGCSRTPTAPRRSRCSPTLHGQDRRRVPEELLEDLFVTVLTIVVVLFLLIVMNR